MSGVNDTTNQGLQWKLKTQALLCHLPGIHLHYLNTLLFSKWISRPCFETFRGSIYLILPAHSFLKTQTIKNDWASKLRFKNSNHAISTRNIPKSDLWFEYGCVSGMIATPKQWMKQISTIDPFCQSVWSLFTTLELVTYHILRKNRVQSYCTNIWLLRDISPTWSMLTQSSYTGKMGGWSRFVYENFHVMTRNTCHHVFLTCLQWIHNVPRAHGNFHISPTYS